MTLWLGQKRQMKSYTWMRATKIYKRTKEKLNIKKKRTTKKNAELLNQDEYGFGLDEVPDMDNLFDKSGLQPDQYGVIC
eukprot:4163415-Amphidinium_carterae.1